MSFSSLKLDFKSQTLEDWKNAARQELEGHEPFEKLSIHKGSLRVQPYYDASQNIISPLPPSTYAFLGARSWKNTPRVVVADAKQANHEILEHLNQGADGVIVEIKNGDADPEFVFDQVQLPYCSISFQYTAASQQFLERFKIFAEKRFNPEQITGSIFFPHPKEVTDTLYHWPNFKSVGIIADAKETDSVATLVELLAGAISASEKNKLDRNFVSKVAFQIPVGTDFFLEIAKIKALKHLWAGVAQAYGVELKTPVFVHAYSHVWLKETFEPHGNLIKQTTSGLSAVLGGCDALTLEADPQHRSLGARMARNASSILREESHLSQVADPAIGSYYIDDLTAQLITEAWKKFQTLML